ncbi:MAG: hypothetical protein R3F19_35505 [Verrucomicrobiales bacterium]
MFSGLLTVCPAKARWIQWEAGFSNDTGKAVISVDGDWTADGLPQLYHYWRENFEAAIEWRKGDLLSVSTLQQQIIYTLGEDADQPLRIDIQLSHVLGYAPMELVETTGDYELASVFIREHGDSGSDLNRQRVNFQLELFKNEAAIRLNDHQEGIDYGAAPNMTLSYRPLFPWHDESVPGPITIDGNKANGVPPDNNTMPTHLSCASFGMDSSSWDKIALTINANESDSVIKKGTQFRIMLSGVPLERSHTSIPTTCDPLPPAIVYDTDKPVAFKVTGVVADEVRSGVGNGSLVSMDSIRHQNAVGSSLPIAFQLRPDRTPSSLEYFNVELRSQGWTNFQPTIVLNFDAYSDSSLSELMGTSWSQTPDFAPGERPPGRPLWESSTALCDKTDSADKGILISRGDVSFRARHLNQRRILMGIVQDGSEGRPAIWKQRETSPEIVDENLGSLEGANDRLIPDLVGFRIEYGRPLPTAWSSTGEGWQSHPLPVERLTIAGRALDINDRRIACGYIDVQLHDLPNRVPCVWRLADATDPQLVLLPLPTDAMNAAAVAINNAGTIVGYYEPADLKSRACLWEESDSGFEFVNLETFGVARGINHFGQIVGGSDLTSYLWQGGERHDIAAIRGGPGNSRALGIMYTGEMILTNPADANLTILKPITTMKF